MVRSTLIPDSNVFDLPSRLLDVNGHIKSSDTSTTRLRKDSANNTDPITTKYLLRSYTKLLSGRTLVAFAARKNMSTYKAI